MTCVLIVFLWVVAVAIQPRPTIGWTRDPSVLAAALGRLTKGHVYRIILAVSGLIMAGLGAFAPLTPSYPEPLAYLLIVCGFGLILAAMKGEYAC